MKFSQMSEKEISEYDTWPKNHFDFIGGLLAFIIISSLIIGFLILVILL